MTRTIIPCPAPPVASDGEEPGTSRGYDIRVITPLFGGGAVAGKNDPITLIRGASIRGQLRFWWRATRGAACDSVAELREREGRIWGTATEPSPVSIRVGAVSKGKVGQWAEYQRLEQGGFKSIPRPADPAFPAYALFPFQGKLAPGRSSIAEQPAEAVWSASFKLIIEWPRERDDLEQEIEPALWAWVNFGGLGARTRRGCGALFCRRLAPADASGIARWYADCRQKYGLVDLETPREWPTLPCRIFAKLANGQLMSPTSAWSQSVRTLGDFRQGVDIGRNPGASGPRPGRSRWPEADSIRRILSITSGPHARVITTPENAFPRAEFGLPIIFHFQGEPIPDQELLPKKSGKRMASPLILRPLALDVDRAAAMIVRLVTPQLNEVQLKRFDDRPRLAQDSIRRPNLAAYGNSPLRSRTASGSALEAFIEFAKERGFR